MKQTALSMTLSTMLVFLAGCEVTSTDVDAVREDVREQQWETQQAQAEGSSEIREKQQRERQLQETSMQQPIDEQAKRDVIEAERETGIRIDSMRDRLAALKGAEKDSLSVDIEVAKIRCKALSDAIHALENEKVTEWVSTTAAVEDAVRQAQKTD